VRDFADNLQNLWGNKVKNYILLRRAEVKRSAQDIRMGVKVESHKEKGGGHGAGHLLEHAGVEWLGQALSSHGHDKGGSKPSTPSGGGGHA